MDSGDALAAIGAEGARLLEVASSDPARGVPTYPGWTLGDLLAHTGSVHRWVTELVRTAARERIHREAYGERAAASLVAWYRAGLEQLVDALTRADPAAPVWTLTGPGEVRFWQSRMSHETAVHRWDAELAFGTPTPFAPWLGASGIPETLEIHVARPLRDHAVGDGRSLVLACTDVQGAWTVCCNPDGVAVEPGRRPAAAQVAGSASDVWLFVMGRPSAGLRRTGDGDVVEALERAIRSVPAPSY